MPEQTVAFGYYPHPCDFCIGDISISSLKHEGAAAYVGGNIDKDWFYAPHSNRAFALPKTHCLRHKNADSKEHLDFLVWCFSFFVGMRLTTLEAGFIDSTPRCPGALIEFLPKPTDKAIDLSERFWQNNRTGKGVKIVPAIIHALFLGQNPHGFVHENFMFLYIALDACWKLFEVIDPDSSQTSNQTSHLRRFKALCRQYDIFVPNCVKDIPHMRNNIVHEAMMFGLPLGFFSDDNKQEVEDVNRAYIEMRGLACRFLVALLGRQDSAYFACEIDRPRRWLNLGE